MAKMYYTEEEAMDKLGLSQEELTAHVRDRKLRLFKDGDRNMFMASEVDAIAPQDDEEEVELAPVEPAAHDDVTLSDADAPAVPGKEDTVITAEGISIFDDEDLEIDAADPMAKTQIAQSIEDQIAIEGVGSGSGLLDLTRESDDTSLGEVIDRIDLDDTSGEEIALPAGGAFGEPPMAIESGPTIVAEIPEAVDAGSGMFSGFIVGAGILALLLGAITLAVSWGVVPSYVSILKENILVVLIGAVVLVGVFGVIGLLIGKSIATRQQAVQEMSG